jgi:hypothetical protein
MQRIATIMASVAFLFFVVAATAQEGKGEVSVQLTGLYTKDSNGSGTFQRATDSAGLLVTYRKRLFRWISAEGAYGYSRDSQVYAQPSFQPFGMGRIQSNIHQATGGFVVELPFLASLRPYALVEGGALIFTPIENSFGTTAGVTRDANGVFVYGGGVEHPLLTSHLLARLEYRGLVYHAPDFGVSQLNTNAVTHTAQPSVGIAFRF